MLLRCLAEPEPSRVQQLQTPGVEEDRVEVIGCNVAIPWATDDRVPGHALPVHLEVAALGFLEPDHIRRITLYGRDVQRGPVPPGVFLAHVAERSPDVEA